jgi:transposase
MARERDMKRACKKHGAGFKAKVALAAIRGDRTIAKLASESGAHPNQIYNWKKQLLDGATSVFEDGAATAEGAASEAQVDLLYRQIGQLKVENDFWHESSANEPSRTAGIGRARGPDAADRAAMPVAGDVAHGGLSEAGRGQCRGSRNNGADRPAVSGAAFLRLAPDGGVAGDPRPGGQPQTGAATDTAARGVAIYQRPNTSKLAVAHKSYPWTG